MVQKSTKKSGPGTDRDGISDWIYPDHWARRNNELAVADLIEFHREGKWFTHWGLYLGNGLVIHVSSYDLWNLSGGVVGKIVEASTSASDASNKVVFVPLTTASQTLLPEAEAHTHHVKGLSEIAHDLTEMFMGSSYSESEVARLGELEIQASDPSLGCALEDRTKWFIKVENILQIAGRDKFRVHNASYSSPPHGVPRTPEEIFRLATMFKDREVDYSLVSCNCEHFVTSLKYKPRDQDSVEVVPVVTHVTDLGRSSQVRWATTVVSAVSAAVTGLAGMAVALMVLGGRKATAKKS